MAEHAGAYPVLQPQQAKVMVIEDNLDNMDLITTLLREDVGVLYCNTRPSGHTFLRWFYESAAVRANPALRRLNLILLDLHIPGENGYSVLTRLRAIPELAQTRIIAVTANTTAADIARCRSAGFDGFVGKPIDIRRFPEQVRRILAGETVWEAQ